VPSGVVKQVELCVILRYVWSFLCVVYYNRYDLVRSYTHIYRVRWVHVYIYIYTYIYIYIYIFIHACMNLHIIMMRVGGSGGHCVTHGVGVGVARRARARREARAREARARGARGARRGAGVARAW